MPAIDDAAPTKRDLQREETRGRVLAAATGLFAARGFDGTTLPAIGAACGIRVSLIVYHFASKEGLWRACVDAIYAQVNTFLDARMAGIAAASGMDVFRLAIRAHVEAAAAHPSYHRILFQEAMQESDRLRWIVDTHQRAMSARIVVVVEQAQAVGLLPADLPSMYLKFLVSGMLTLPITLAPEYRLLTGEDPLDEDFIARHVEACLEMMMGIRG